MEGLMVIGLVAAGIVVIVVVAGIAAGALFCADIMSYTDKGSKTLDPAGSPVGKALVVYNPGISGAAKNAAAEIAGDLQSKGYTVNLAGIKSSAAANVSGYDVIIAGGPMYFGKVSNSVDAYLTALKPQKGVAVAHSQRPERRNLMREISHHSEKQVAADPCSSMLNKTAATKRSAQAMTVTRTARNSYPQCCNRKVRHEQLYVLKPQKDRALYRSAVSCGRQELRRTCHGGRTAPVGDRRAARHVREPLCRALSFLRRRLPGRGGRLVREILRAQLVIWQVF